jgi:putative hydrolase of the HAD superfamily
MAKSFGDFRYMSFDVVGTLIDFEGGLIDCLGGIARESGTPLDGEEALNLYRAARYMPDVQHFPDDLARVYDVIAPKLGLPAGEGYTRRLRDSVASWRPFPDSAAALARLATRYKLIAMTNAQRWAFEHFARTLGNPFWDSVTVDDALCEKPDPNVFGFARGRISRSGFGRDEILHVAQSQYHDIGVAKALGYTTCWIERRKGLAGFGGTIAVEKLTTPDFHFATLGELADKAV